MLWANKCSFMKHAGHEISKAKAGEIILKRSKIDIGVKVVKT